MSNFSYSKLVEGLSNDDLFVRSGALFQLTESGADCQPDASHAFIDGLEKHGWQDAFVEHAYAETLPIDTEVAKRILNWLKTSPPYEPKIGEGNMSLLIMLEWLSSAPAEVIKSAVGDVASLPNDESPEVEELHESIALAIDLLDHDADQCRSSLDSCRETIAKGGELETELIDIKALVKRLNDLGQIDKDLVIEWANLKADFEDEFQLSETEVKICIAFEMAKEAGIPISVDTCLDLLKHEEEWLSDSIIKTMIKMADEEMLDAMIKQYPKLSDEQKVDWLLFFEKVRFPGREEKIRDLATLEKNLSYRSHLGVLLCFYGTDPALKYARETFESLAGEIEGIDIIEVLYALKRLKGDSSDELDEWREVLDEIHSTTLKMLSGDYDMESIMDGEIDSYDPMIAPDPEIWLSMDEGERMALVRDFCEQYEGGIEGIESHAALHTVVENQLAEDPDDLPVTETLVRLMKAGVNRHEAIHALCYAMMNQIYEIQTNAKEFDLKAHTKALKELEADQWMGSAKRVEKSSYQSPSASTPKVGRNDDCPCGSGKKYKKCCIKNAN